MFLFVRSWRSKVKCEQSESENWNRISENWRLKNESKDWKQWKWILKKSKSENWSTKSEKVSDPCEKLPICQIPLCRLFHGTATKLYLARYLSQLKLHVCPYDIINMIAVTCKIVVDFIFVTTYNSQITNFWNKKKMDFFAEKYPFIFCPGATPWQGKG